MDAKQIELLEAADGTGELLVVIYAGGIAPGTKRRIVVRSIDTDADQLNVLENGAIRTYMISKTRVVDEDDPAPWMPENAGKVVPVDPLKYFSGWKTGIGGALLGALGVFTRYVIDKQKTEPARKAAIERGMAKTEATRRIKIMKREIVINVPPVYRFEIGDLFGGTNDGRHSWVQVLDVENTDAGMFIEAHWWRGDGRIGFRIPAAVFADCLRLGVIPEKKFRIFVSKRPSLMLLSD